MPASAKKEMAVARRHLVCVGLRRVEPEIEAVKVGEREAPREEVVETTSASLGLEVAGRELAQEQERLAGLRRRWERLDGETQRGAAAASVRLSELSGRLRKAGDEARSISTASAGKVASLRSSSALEERRRLIQAQQRLLLRWLEVAQLATAAGERGDGRAARRLRDLAEENGRFAGVAARASAACRKHCDEALALAAAAVEWPFGAVKERSRDRADPRAVAELTRATDAAWEARRTGQAPMQVFSAALLAPIEARFAAHFEDEDLKLVHGDSSEKEDKRPEVAAKWLGRVAAECSEALLLQEDDEDTEGLRAAVYAVKMTCVALARRHVTAALPFESAREAEDHAAAYGDFERSLKVAAGEGPLAVIAGAHFTNWLAADRLAIEHLCRAALENEEKHDALLFPEPKATDHKAPRFEKRYKNGALGPLRKVLPELALAEEYSAPPRSDVAWEVAASIAAVVSRAATLEPKQRLEATMNALSTAQRIITTYLKRRWAAVGLDHVNAVVAAKHRGQSGSSPPRLAWATWLGACGAAQVAQDLSLEVRAESVDDYGADDGESLAFERRFFTGGASAIFSSSSAAADKLDLEASVAAEYCGLADDLAAQVEAFGERLGSLAASALAAAPKNPESWLKTFFQEITDRLPARCVASCRLQLKNRKLAEVVASDDHRRVAKRSAALARAFAAGPKDAIDLLFWDLFVLASLPRDRRQALVTAFEALCLDDTDTAPESPSPLDPRAQKKRQRDIDAAIAQADDATDASLRAMLAANDVHRLDPRPAAQVLVASLYL